MKLRDYSATLEEKMSEFDLWITPTLGEIRDTAQFLVNLTALKRGFDYLDSITNHFNSYVDCFAANLSRGFLELIDAKTSEEAKEILDCVFNVLLLATGKTDNNLKCQFPILLRRAHNIREYPKKQRSRWVMKELPRTLEMEAVTNLIIQLKEQEDFQRLLLRSYVELIISDTGYAKQLWSLGNAYVLQKQAGNESYLISSIVIFQSRGSITATQGHIPETLLRSYMDDWGLKAGIDSGSVSHKVVDQTDSSRTVTLRKFPQAVFIEYLDGAGYYSSLNGDLRKMLSKPTTKDFFQIKTAPLKLRRELQGINFVTTLEIEHAILRSSGNRDEIVQVLLDEGYTQEEINTAIDFSIENASINTDESGNLKIKPERIPIVRRYCFLDLIANYGQTIETGIGYLIVAGYSHTWGLPQADLVRIALDRIPNLQNYWQKPVDPFDDIQWLINLGFIKTM